eukprot:2551592-Rhodomonas_salina.1
MMRVTGTGGSPDFYRFPAQSRRNSSPGKRFTELRPVKCQCCVRTSWGSSRLDHLLCYKLYQY